MSLLLRRKAYRDLRAVIEDAAVNQPRSLQARIGPSQLGTPCDKCLAWALAELPRPREFAWFPVIGTGVHALLEEWVKPHDRYLTEERVTVGTVGGRDVTGSCDVYDTKTHTIIDYKITGYGTISKARKSGPSEQYRAQAHLYGKGFEDTGRTVENVAIWFMPRTDANLDNGHYWTEPYDRGHAEAVLERANLMAAEVDNHTDDLLEWIDTLASSPECWTCKKERNE